MLMIVLSERQILGRITYDLAKNSDVINYLYQNHYKKHDLGKLHKTCKTILKQIEAPIICDGMIPNNQTLCSRADIHAGHYLINKYNSRPLV